MFIVLKNIMGLEERLRSRVGLGGDLDHLPIFLQLQEEFR
jgi:hypothetical protein